MPHKPEIVLLFDTGPLQLGAPRLAHLALWIAHTRRAELVGARLLWGSVQRLLERCENSADAAQAQGEWLNTRVDAMALDELAHARSPSILDAKAIARLSPILTAYAGAEFWWIGAALDAGSFDLLGLLPQEIRQKFRRIKIETSRGFQIKQNRGGYQSKP